MLTTEIIGLIVCTLSVDDANDGNNPSSCSYSAR